MSPPQRFRERARMRIAGQQHASLNAIVLCWLRPYENLFKSFVHTEHRSFIKSGKLQLMSTDYLSKISWEFFGYL